MAIFEMRRNARVLIDAQPHRLLKRLDGDLWQLEDERTGRLAEHSHSALLEMLRLGTLSYALEATHGGAREQPAAASAPEPIHSAAEQLAASRSVWDNAPAGLKAEAQRRLGYVKATLGRPRSKTFMREAIGQRANDTKDSPAPSVSSVTRWIGDYIGGGRDVVALLPRFKDRGNRTARFPQPVVDLTNDSIDAVFLTRERPTVQDTVDDAIAHVNAANRNRPRSDRLPLPTRRLVQSLIARRDPIDVCTARFGPEYAANKYRQVLRGGRIGEALRRVEIDHTPVNMMVIDDRTFLPLGRPWLSAALDTGNKCFLGYALSFEPPSFLSVMRCLKHAILPKTCLASRYPKLRHDWPCHGLFDSLGLDNGKEFHAKSLQDFADRFGIDLDYCPVRMPWLKGSIERALGSINRGIAHGQPGTTFEDLIERGDYKSASRACITLEALHEIVHEWIVDYYHQRVHKTLGMSPDQAWHEQTRHRDIPLPTSAAELDQALAIPVSRTLTHKGIELDHLFYNSQECLGVLARTGGGGELDVRRPADDVGYLYLVDPQSEHHIRVPVIERYREYATGLTPWQHTQCVRYASRHYGGRHDAVALAQAKRQIRDGFVQALARVRSSARKSAARWLHNVPDPAAPAPASSAPDKPAFPNGSPSPDRGPAPSPKVSAAVMAKALKVTFAGRRQR